MSHIPFIAGAAVSFTAQPATLTEIFSATTVNRRVIADLTGRTRARIYVGGGAAGASTAQLRAQYTLDLTGATGWDYLDATSGPQVGILTIGGSTPTQVSPWVAITAAARTAVLLRIVGILGDDATTPTISHLGVEVSGPPLYASNSLEGGSVGRVWAFFGGSQIGGGGIPGDFGTLDAGISGALNPLFALGAGASGITYIKNGVTLTAAPTEHGAEIGFLDELRLAGKVVGSTAICRYVNATKAQDWVSTHFATMQADAVTAGVTPSVACYVLGSTDANSDATVGRLANDLRALHALVRAAWAGCSFVVMGQVTVDGVTYPKLVEARLVGQGRFEDAIDGRRAWVDRTTVSALLQPDDDHPTSAGHVVQGRLYAAPVLAYGVPG